MESAISDAVIYGCSFLGAFGGIGLALTYVWHLNTRETSRMQHEETRAALGADIDKVLRCVEPESGPPEKVIEGLIPPRV